MLLGVVTLLAAGLRGYQAGESLWVDELHTAWTAAGDFFEVSYRARMGNQSPLYFYLPWVLSGLLGMNEYALRLPSLAAGTALVPLVYFLVYGWTTSRGAALLSAVLTAIDRDLIFFAQEARPYALVQLVSLLQIWLFWKLTVASTDAARGKNEPLAARQMTMRFTYSFLTVLLVWLHYTAALLLIGEVLFYTYLVLLRKGSPHYRWYEFGFDLTLAAAFCSPLVFPLQEVFNRRHLWRFVTFVPTWNMVRAAGLYVGLPLAVLGSVAFVRLLAGCKTLLARVDSRAIALLIGWLWIPLVVTWLSTITGLARLFFPRYLTGSALALPALGGVAMATIPHRGTQMVYALLMIAFSIGTSGMIEQYRCDGRLVGDRDENWRAAVQYISESIDDDGPLPVVLDASLIEDELLLHSPSAELRDYYRFPLAGIYRLDTRGYTVIPRYGQTDEDHDALRDVGEYWLVVRGTEAAAEKMGSKLREIEEMLSREFSEYRKLPDIVEPWQHFGDGLHVAHVRMGR